MLDDSKIVIKGADNWFGVLLNMMQKTGIKAETVVFRRRGEGLLWLLGKGGRKYDIIYHLSAGSALFCIVAKLRGSLVVNHWIGSDMCRYHGPFSLHKRISTLIQNTFVDLHLSDSEIIQDELLRIGIKSELVRLLPESLIGEVCQLPSEPTVLAYWMDSRFEFYGGPLVLQLAEEFPEVKFIIVRATGSGLKHKPANVEFLGFVTNMPDIYKKCDCLIRMPEHDGLSAMVLETMSRGRYVIYNKQLPFTHFANDYESARKALKEILAKKNPNIDGAVFVRENFDVAREAVRLRELLEKMVQNQK